MTYNILNGGKGREGYILEVIEANQPDVIVFQEVYDPDFLASLAVPLEMDYFFGPGNAQRRVALLSRLPIHNAKSHHPRWPIARNFVAAEIEYQPRQTFHLIGIHPMAILSMPFEVWRWLEARYIINHYQMQRDQPCLIAGDFNAVAPTDTIGLNLMPGWLKWMLRLQGSRAYHYSMKKYLSAGFSDCFRELNPDDTGFTLPPPEPNTRLDYILANDTMRPFLKKCWAVREPKAVLNASDHYPVMAVFDIETH
ncbi:MAG: endonuclease/exonuclease/phosphatase family protein [Chloroflexota bacterium]